VPLEDINVPIAMLVGKKDTYCSWEEAKKTETILGDNITLFKTYENFGHFDFNSANDKQFVNTILSQLEIP
jgi:surfactin synthase thioesterase subunit